MKNASKTIENIAIIITVLFFLWVVASYIDIISNNLDGAEYAVWNFFNMII